MPVSPFPCGVRAEAAVDNAIIIRIHGRRSIYDFVFNSILWQILKKKKQKKKKKKKKKRKPVSRRYVVGSIARSPHGHRTETAR